MTMLSNMMPLSIVQISIPTESIVGSIQGLSSTKYSGFSICLQHRHELGVAAVYDKPWANPAPGLPFPDVGWIVNLRRIPFALEVGIADFWSLHM